MDQDAIAALRAVDPARQSDLGAVDPGAVDALREGIIMTGTASPAAHKRRVGRRGALAIGLSTALVGGGAAYAAYQITHGPSAAADGLNCIQTWSQGEPSAAGPELTGNPVADCAQMLAEKGAQPLADPVAFRKGNILYVAPRTEVPDGAVLVPLSAEDAKARELEASTRDLVDGAQSICMTEAEADGWVTSELARLGLTGWTIAIAEGKSSEPGATCAAFDVNDATSTLTVLPERNTPPATHDPASDTAPVTGIRDELRRGITDACVSVDDARALADKALAGLDYEPWPTTTVVDESVTCARVDMEVGGNIQVTVYGPKVARP